MDLKGFYDKEIVTLPNAVLYPHQKKAWTEFNKITKKKLKGVKLLILEWHRRCGKDVLLLQLLTKEAVKNAGNYYYIFPEKRQAREAIFEGIDMDGRRMIDYIPYQLIHKIREQEMIIYIKTNTKNSDGSCVYSTIQFVSSDADAKVGTSIKGAVFSEFALCNPEIWFLLEPSLAKTGGFAGMISTPRGEDNYMVDLINMIKNDPNSYTEGKMTYNPTAFVWEQMTIEDSSDFLGNPIFTQAEYEQKKLQGVPLEKLLQEYYCDRVTASEGAFYKRQFARLYEAEQITPFDPNPDLPVFFGIDLGATDRCVIWVGQMVGKELYVVDYFADSGESIDHYVKWCMEYVRDGGFPRGRIFFPHDVKQVNSETGRSPIQRVIKLMRRYPKLNYSVIPKTSSVLADIDTVREILPNCFFASNRCYTAIQFMKRYTKKEPTKGRVRDYDANGSKPLHDEASNYADAFRYLALGVQRFKY